MVTTRQPGMITFDREQRVRSANALARAIHGTSTSPGSPRHLLSWYRTPEWVDENVTTGDYSVLRGFRSPQGFQAFACHYQWMDEELHLRFEPLDWLVGFAEQLGDQVMVTDADGTILYVNGASQRFLRGSDVPDIRGTNITERAARAGVTGATVRSMLLAALQDGSCRETFRVSNDWRHLHFLTSATPFRYCQRVCGVVWTTRSMAHHEAPHDGQALTALAYRLAAMYQHEVRNPLQTAQAAIALARMRDSGGHCAALFDVAERNLQAISDILGSNPVASAESDPPTPVLLSNIVTRAITDAALRQSSHRVAFAHQVPEREPRVVCNADGMTRVFANLFRNTAQAAPAAHVQITYTWDDRWLTCIVDDDGPGFPEHLLSGMLATRNLASHFGLVLVTAIVEACGGRVGLHRAPSGGARVELTLPLAGADTPDRLRRRRSPPDRR